MREYGKDRREISSKRITRCMIGSTTRVGEVVDLFKCEIGMDCKVSSFVFIEGNVRIGDGCKIKPFVFIPSGVQIGNNVFIGHGTKFTNDRYPSAKTNEFKLEPTVVEDNVSIGANCTILPGLIIGKNAIIGAGSVVTKDVEPDMIVAGNPAKVLRSRFDEEI